MVKPSLPHHDPSIAGTNGTIRSTLPIHGDSFIGLTGWDLQSDWWAQTDFFEHSFVSIWRTIAVRYPQTPKRLDTPVEFSCEQEKSR